MRTLLLALAAGCVAIPATPVSAAPALGTFTAQAVATCGPSTCSVFVDSTSCSLTRADGSATSCTLTVRGALGKIPPPVVREVFPLCTGLGRGTLTITTADGAVYTQGIGFAAVAYGFVLGSPGVNGSDLVTVAGSGVLECTNPLFTGNVVHGTIAVA